MDRLTAFVAINHLRLRLNIVQKYPRLLENEKMAIPNLRGLTKAMEMLEHNLELDAGGLIAKIQTVGARGKAAITKGHTRIDNVSGRIGEVEKFVTAIEGSNGGDPLDGSSDASKVSTDAMLTGTEQVTAQADTAKAEPAASWGGAKP